MRLVMLSVIQTSGQPRCSVPVHCWSDMFPCPDAVLQSRSSVLVMYFLQASANLIERNLEQKGLKNGR